jgi:hypothetical protein
MIDQVERVTSMIKGHINTLILGESERKQYGYVVTLAPFGPVQLAEGAEPQFGPVWAITITRKSALLGYPDIARMTTLMAVVPPGNFPPDEQFKQATGAVLAAVNAAYNAEKEGPA